MSVGGDSRFGVRFAHMDLLAASGRSVPPALTLPRKGGGDSFSALPVEDGADSFFVLSVEDGADTFFPLPLEGGGRGGGGAALRRRFAETTS